MKKCVCRFPNCKKVYDPNKSRADLRGYCSQKCMKANARRLGWREGKEPNYIKILTRYNPKAVGDVPVKEELKNGGVPPAAAPAPAKPKPTEPDNIVKYLVHQLATRLMVDQRAHLRELDAQEGRASADDLNYVAEQTLTHFDNCTVEEIRKAILNFKR